MASIYRSKYILLAMLLFTSCAGGEVGGVWPSLDFGAPPDTPFTIYDESKLIGGPLATGRVGDVLLENDKIRVIIQKPAKNSWVGSFGGQIVDADRVRTGASSGNDNFQFMLPLINIEWTMNTFDYEVVSSGEDGGPKILRSRGVIDTYDYVDVDFISPVAKALTGQSLYFSPRFDDAMDPFTTTDLKNIDPFITEEFRLDPGANYVKMDLTITNRGETEVKLPVGYYVNGGGRVQLLIPGVGFQPDTMTEVSSDAPCIIYAASPGSDVSYGFFYDVRQYAATDEDGKTIRLPGAFLSFSGVTGILFGEEFLKVLPLGGRTSPQVNFSIPPASSRTVTTYFVVGDASAGSVLDTGLEVLEIPRHKISGKVVDALGNPIKDATVFVENEDGNIIVTYRTGLDGAFEGYLSTGEDTFASAFGSGKYTLGVDKKGYLLEGEGTAGSCSPSRVDVTQSDVVGIVCTLGSSGILRFLGGVVDEDTGENIPARMTIVGFDPSDFDAKVGNFTDMMIHPRPFGIVDVLYFNSYGTIGLERRDSLRIEPGRYILVFSRGPEYSRHVREVNVLKNSVVEISGVTLKRVVKTPGFINGDFHLHSIFSPDSSVYPEERVLSAVGEGLDILMSTDHDYLVDYAPYVERLEGEGIIPSNSVVTLVSVEVSPNQIGHYNPYPLEADPEKTCGGALDWTASPLDEMSPKPDFVMSSQDIIDYFREMEGERVIQMNHLMDQTTSILLVGGWVMTTAYMNLGVPPLSSYGDPIQSRLVPHAPGLAKPYPFGTSEMMATGFTAMELATGPQLWENHLRYGGLPLWFNALNLGFIVTATGNSDSHSTRYVPIGIPRNYVASNVDPRDGRRDFSSFDKDEFAKAVNGHHVIVTTGPFVKMKAIGEDGEVRGIGDTIKGKSAKFIVEVESPSWAWFDTIEIYANTEPIPADDETGAPLEGIAADPAKFFEPYHLPRYYYEPYKVFRTIDGTLENWEEKNGVIRARVEFTMDVKEDTWVVAFVMGTQETPGYKSLFPFVTYTLKNGAEPPKMPEQFSLEDFWLSPSLQAPAWALTNPIFMDVDGDIDGDGADFEALYVRNGLSPLSSNPPIRQAVATSEAVLQASGTENHEASDAFFEGSPGIWVNQLLLK